MHASAWLGCMIAGCPPPLMGATLALAPRGGPLASNALAWLLVRSRIVGESGCCRCALPVPAAPLLLQWRLSSYLQPAPALPPTKTHTTKWKNNFAHLSTTAPSEAHSAHSDLSCLSQPKARWHAGVQLPRPLILGDAAARPFYVPRAPVFVPLVDHFRAIVTGKKLQFTAA